MPRRHVEIPSRLIMIVGGLIVLASIWPSRELLSQQVRDVFVRNFPERQEIFGRVSVGEAIPSTKAFERTRTVSPVRREETVHLIDGGVVDVERFSTATVTVYGWIKSGTFEAGQVGIMLLPEEEVFSRALEESGQLLMPIEVMAEVDPRSAGYFVGQSTFPLGFERYRVLFYNSSTKPAEATVKVYLGQ